MIRTELQTDADRLDLELFRALSQAEGYITKHPHQEPFADVAIRLREARRQVRKMMHRADVEATGFANDRGTEHG